MILINRRSLFAVACAISFAGQGAVFADDTEDSINEGLKAYQAGNYADAAKNLQYALSLINEKKADSALEALPKKIGNWEGDKGETQSLGALGGGNVISRNYTQGSKSALISITMDSPLVQQMAGLITNPMFAAQAGRPRKVNGHDATYNKENDELLMVIDSRMLIKIEATGSSEEEILELAKGINVNALSEKK